MQTRKKANLIGYILRRKCLLNKLLKVVTGRRRKRDKQLLDELKEKSVCCKLKEEALDRTLWKSRSGTFYGTFLRESRTCVIPVVCV